MYQNGNLMFEVNNNVFSANKNKFVIKTNVKNEGVTILSPKDYPSLSYSTYIELQKALSEKADLQKKYDDLQTKSNNQ
jgi:hypothetical protein